MTYTLYMAWILLGGPYPLFHSTNYPDILPHPTVPDILPHPIMPQNTVYNASPNGATETLSQKATK